MDTWDTAARYRSGRARRNDDLAKQAVPKDEMFIAGLIDEVNQFDHDVVIKAAEDYGK